MPKSYGPLRIVLGCVCLSHLIIGIAGCFPFFSIDRLAAIFYRASLTKNPQMEHIIQMFGVYMLTIGILGVFALLDPVKNKAIIYSISFLLFARVLQRILFAGQVNAIFGIPTGWYWIQTIFFFAIAMALVLLRPKEA